MGVSMNNKSRSPVDKGTICQIFAAVTGNLMAISDGMTVGWTGPMIPYLLGEKSHLQITKYQAEWLETWLLLGAIVGLPATIYCVEKLGRKKSLLFASFVLLLAWIIIPLSDRIEYIYISRFCSGMGGDMAFVAAPMYIAEIANQNIRGFFIKYNLHYDVDRSFNNIFSRTISTVLCTLYNRNSPVTN
ncbi:hypothetical protein NQ317_015377 [Molorchus minor]|uniref:Major facilitator superfamily (MFS) profile domain-containing protein n=1 Tax=Molorchus minor TaxID=1323400 RepID=A0ABQ9J401_9CUCU|nr:hypothetical protein NQ317_015377 [Molorchus minor]